MGAGNAFGGDDMDVDALRAERQNRLNPPDFAPGQGDDDSFFDDDLFGGDNIDAGSTQPQGLSLGLDTGGSPAGSFMGAGLNNSAQTPMQQQSAMSTEDKVFDALGKGAKGSVNFIKDITQSLKMVNAKFWAGWGSNTFVVSCATAVVGGVLLLFGAKSVGVNFIVGSLLSAGTGGLVLMLNVDKAKGCATPYKDGGVVDNSNNQGNFNQPPMSDATMTGGEEDDFSFDEEDDDDGFSFDEGDEEDDDGDFSFDEEDGEDEFGFDGDDFFAGADEVLSESPTEGMSTEEALNTLPDIPAGMYTRQYLYDAFTKKLGTIKPDFATVKVIDEDSDVFLQCEVRLREACSATGVKEENLPTLRKLEENLFTIKFTFDRPTGLKPDLVANELANIYAYAEGEFNSSVYAKSDVVGKSCIITVFTGETALISLKDMYNNCKDFMLDSKNYMPVVLGINPLGKVIKFDFRKLESILITGMPRSGKSWFVQAVLTQMCAFVPPSELNIYICDPKDGISDFKGFKLPHVKKFVSGDANIVNTLRAVVKDLAPRRKKIIGDAGFVNIWDYKEKYPDVHMPIIYILIDEVVTLAERMEKEVKQEFQGLLVELISQLPALGIRAFLIPHVVKNDIIAKTATDLIPCRISVCGDAGHIESSTGTKPKDFPYKLTNTGDMAVRLPAVSADTMFIHGPALSDSNTKNNELFEYLLKVWSKLEPDEIKDSVSAHFEEDMANRTMLDNLNSNPDTVGNIDVFDNNYGGVSDTNEDISMFNSLPNVPPRQSQPMPRAQSTSQAKSTPRPTSQSRPISQSRPSQQSRQTQVQGSQQTARGTGAQVSQASQSARQALEPIRPVRSARQVLEPIRPVQQPRQPVQPVVPPVSPPSQTSVDDTDDFDFNFDDDEYNF